MKNEFKALLNAISTYIGKPIQGIVFSTKDKSLGIKYTRFTRTELQDLEVLASKYNPSWIVNQVTNPRRGFEPVTWIGPPKGSSEDELFDAVK